MQDSLLDEVTTGEDMEWQEKYVFQTNGTFTKVREQNGSTTSLSGRYQVIDNFEERQLELMYTRADDLIMNCDTSLTEVMIFDSPNSFFSTANTCDGPGLWYAKMN